ncbi:unnamed protein product [Cyprideis torosa]|uniref:NADH dehydrogenase [ubiquinone] 1 alpha subcomplex subunit 12 n=1 Tax=Cyprideis torosa TaxID=163714 RepID=A0A7R8ZHP0_9CRUS|nr:unnamed protein product [Cyprideis torosa]CAG0882945.1 unnamed protein product [Cyprideis torosa]
MTSLLKYIGLDKTFKLFKIIKANGGLVSSFVKIYKNNDIRIGEFVGEDCFGNKYYHDPNYFIGRSRWVEYNHKVGLNFDASQVPPEWFGWLHYKTDDPPSKVPREKKPWMADPTPNFSGTPLQYTPYSTTPPKIEPWQPPTNLK